MNDSASPPPDPRDAVWQSLARHVAGEDAPGERDALRAELEANPERAALVDALEGALSGLREPRAPVDVEAALASVMARRDRPALTVERGGASQSPPPVAARPPVWWKNPAILRAAAAALLLAGAIGVWRYLAVRGAPGPSAVYATETGRLRRVELSDGSVAVLGPESHLAVVADYGQSERRIELTGEAYFEVRHDADRPFVVHTSAAEVTDLGTAFVVRASDSTGTHVAVTQGSVRVTPREGAAAVLKAGDEAAVTASGAVALERGTVTEDEAAWTQGRLIFRDAPLSEVAMELRRWFGVTVRIGDPALARRHLNAHLEDVTRDQALRIIAVTVGGEVRMRGDTAVIVPLSPSRAAPAR